MESAMSTEYQSLEKDRPGAQLGWYTKPATTVSATSGRRLGLPEATMVIETFSLLNSGSLTPPPPPWASKRSEKEASRTSRDLVARKRRPSKICASRPSFQLS